MFYALPVSKKEAMVSQKHFAWLKSKNKNVVKKYSVQVMGWGTQVSRGSYVTVYKFIVGKVEL